MCKLTILTVDSLDDAKLDLVEPKKHGGWHVAFLLWSGMGLGDREKVQ